MIANPGIVFKDHVVAVPLDHSRPDDGETIEVFAREIVAADRARDELPWLLFLQGGPGSPGTRPFGQDAWLRRALRTHRVLMLDQRGTGRSTPITARTVQGMTDEQIAAYLRLMRADSIVRDAEILREEVAGWVPWDTFGQSYGGFCTLTYLSIAPEGLRNCYVTGGLPGLTATAQDVYARTYPRVAAKNAAYYQAYPEDAAAIRRLSDRLTAEDVRLPDGDRLTARRLRLLGSAFGMSNGFSNVHWLIESAGLGAEIPDAFRYAVTSETGFVDRPLYALQEYCYGAPGSATGWAAEEAIALYPEFAEKADPLYFTGEMMFPWMFEEIKALRPFAGAAEILARAQDWPALYDPARLASNEVPVRAAVYHDDMYVDAGLSLETAAAVGNVRTWVTNEFEHDGLRADGERVLGRLMDMATGLA
ncbi:alpha/beta fold hydrolase [Winogradskya humida]|uniref:alpha/beta fold hydrolase n=1 Tax=Winogradskya humida TaxID=113566 RepID=UPI001940A9D6|nr:alpha/beta fold hydrolase [Actinoplanes humidus]